MQDIVITRRNEVAVGVSNRANEGRVGKQQLSHQSQNPPTFHMQTDPLPEPFIASQVHCG